MLEEIFAEHTGRTPAQVRDDTERDLILTAQAALEYGVVDAVLTRRVAPGS
jgi:ATP-dependent Clp protease protease subunit